MPCDWSIRSCICPVIGWKSIGFHLSMIFFSDTRNETRRLPYHHPHPQSFVKSCPLTMFRHLVANATSHGLARSRCHAPHRAFGIFSDIKKQFQEEWKSNPDLQTSWKEVQKSQQKMEEQWKGASDQVSSQAKASMSAAKESFEGVAKNIKVEKKKKKKEEEGPVEQEQEKEEQGEKEKAGDLKNQLRNLTSTVRQYRQQYLYTDAFIPRMKHQWKEAAQELFGREKHSMEDTLSRGSSRVVVAPRVDSETPDSETPDSESTSTSALVVVQPGTSAWERIGARLQETPIIQGMMDAAKQAAASRAGRTIGKGAKAASDKFGDAREDVRELWETSQNPWIYRLSSVYDGLFGETETASAIREIRRADPGFVLEEWKDDIEETVIPVVLSAFLLGESRKLKAWMGEAAYNTVNFAIRYVSIPEYTRI